MKIVCIGGGPAGLYFGLLMKMRNPAHDITVVERNKPYDTFGWGVVFSDATMDNMRQWDPVTAARSSKRSTTGTTLSWSSKAKSSARAATASSVSAARNC
jgi:2-polyprenyl-6-methoxyphenol hydroxylase-like FAD-dependent oxidoreductase